MSPQRLRLAFRARCPRRNAGDLKTLHRFRQVALLTGIFEKEVLILVYYLVFSSIAGAFPEAALQGLLLTAGTMLQAWLRLVGKAGLWKHFIMVAFYLAGTLASRGEHALGTGLLLFLLAVACLSALYEGIQGRLRHPLVATILGMVHSALVFTAFPLLYSLFLLNKKGLSLETFFQEKEHFLVFLGYSTFYLSVVVSKQLHTIQNALLRKWCRLEGAGIMTARAPAGRPPDGSAKHRADG